VFGRKSYAYKIKISKFFILKKAFLSPSKDLIHSIWTSDEEIMDNLVS